MKRNHSVTTDTYQKITDFVIDQLEKGQVIWQKGWNSLGLPKNIVTGHHYKGWNVFLLNFITMYYEFKTPYFITYKQAMDMGGSIRRGQKGYPVVWWATVENKNKVIEMNEEQRHPVYRVPKVHTVFNIHQTHGIEFPEVKQLFRSRHSKLQACEEIINIMPLPQIRFGGNEAFYHPHMDYVQMPNAEQFHSDEAYYQTFFHELAHSTGHQNRLNRKELVESDGFGKDLYSKEELTAELTAAFLSAIAGIDQQTLINSTAYIQGWVNALKNDKRLILNAATHAQVAADYILNKQSVRNIGKVDNSVFLLN